MIFATPDFGIAGAIAWFALFVGALVFVFVVVAAVRGVWLLNSDSSRRRKHGIAWLALSGLVPLLCWQGPPQVVRIVYGNYPLGSYPDNKVQQGMTADQVVAILGVPHKRRKNGDEETWFYRIDSFGLFWFGVVFTPDGFVEDTYGS